MKRDFEWVFAEDAENEAETPAPPRSGRVRGPFWFMATAVFAILFLLFFWRSQQQQATQLETALTQRVQATLDEIKAAQAAGDQERFMALLGRDPAWRADQLQPAWQDFYQHDLTATRAHPYQALIQANVTWQENGRSYQRLLFFEDERGVPRLMSPPAGYWGQSRQQPYTWGTLQYGEADEVWREAMATFIEQQLTQLCLAPCPTLTVSLQPHWSETAAPHTIYLPSPRLVALDEQGQPAPAFWELLAERLADRLALTTIHFAVPETAVPLDYERIAADFMAQEPRIQVEIIRLPLPQPLTPIPPFDAIAQTPALDQLQAGQVYDLTPLVESDPTYDTFDYYSQIWAGVWWQERVWLLPQAGQLRLLFYDKGAYAAQELANPSLRWTWEEMAADLTRLDGEKRWGLLDPGPDLLLAYAYNQANCPGRFSTNDCLRPLSACDVLVSHGNLSQIGRIGCDRPLSSAAIIATWHWYLELAAKPGLVATPLDTPHMEREQLLNNWQSAQRQATIWVDEPVNYENRLLLDPLGVVSFPGSGLFDGVTPLWVLGNHISAASKRPYSTWQWLTYLDQQPPNRPRRLVPARHSVAQATGYWGNLPSPLGEAMRTAFPFAQPVHFEEQRLFTREQITAVLNGELAPHEALYEE
jgi:ABC-type glycerol-3-phosphate transport system substrate-binding protein